MARHCLTWCSAGKHLAHMPLTSNLMKDSNFDPGELTGVDSPCGGCSGRREFIVSSVGSIVALTSLSMLVPVSEIVALSPSASRATTGVSRDEEAATVRYTIPSADAVSTDKTHDLMICRSGDSVFAFALSCPHQNTALRALPRAAGFQCPRHKSKYQPNGTFVSGRATRNMDRLPIRRDGDSLEVNVDVAIRSDSEPQKWAAAVVKL